MTPDHHPELVRAAVHRRADARKMRHFAIFELQIVIHHNPEPNSQWCERYKTPWMRLHQQIVHVLRDIGWWVGFDRHATYARYKSLRATRAGGAWGDMRLGLESHPAISSIAFYRDHHTAHPISPRYAAREGMVLMGMLDRARVERTKRAIARFLVTEGYKDASKAYFASPWDRVEQYCQESWHQAHYKNIWQRRRTHPNNDLDGDGVRMVNGDERWLYGPHGDGGRLMRGTVFHNINNMWWVVVGGEVRNVASYRLFSWRAGLPRKNLADRPLKCLDRLLAKAVADEDFERAIVLRDELVRLKQAIGSASSVPPS